MLAVIEDLQWADGPSLRLVGAALRLSKRSPLCVLGLGRPELDEVFPQLWADQRLVEVRLRELGGRAAEELVGAVLGPDMPRATVDAILARAAGNALCLEELLRAAAHGETTNLPESVLAIAQARLGGLDAPLRRVLRAGSAFGGVFWPGGVAALLGGARRTPPASVTAASRAASSAPGGPDFAGMIRQLVDREIVVRESHSRFVGEEQLAFRSSVLQEAAYATLTDEDRPRAHALAAAWLAEQGDTDALVIANHLSLAGEHERAPPWLLRAAEQALEGGDPAQAATLCERGLAALRRGGAVPGAPADEGCLWLLLAEAHRWRGGFAACERAALAAMEKLPHGSRQWLRAAEEALVAAGRRGDGAAVRALAEAAFEAQVYGDAAASKVTCFCAAGRHFLHAGDVEAADAWMERAAALASTLGPHEPGAMAALHRLRGARARQTGDPLGDRDAYALALAELVRAGDLRAASNARTSFGFACLELGEIDTAEAELRRAQGDAARLGLDAVRVRAQQNLGLVLAARGDLQAALALLSQVVDACRAQGNARFEAWTRVYVARIAERAGDADRAAREASSVQEALASAPSALAGALAVWARALARKGDLPAARERAAEALSILDHLGSIEEFDPLVRATYAEIFGLSDESARRAVTLGERRLTEHAARIDDPARREAYLRGVVEHRALLDLAARLG